MSFQGFADPEMRFFQLLAKHQTREWFAAHKEEFDTGWVAPMKELLAEARTALDDTFPHADLAEPKVFRIHRDVRFAKDKSPYKTNVSGIILAGSERGSVPESPCALYLQLGTEPFGAAGQYSMDNAALGRYRAALLDETRGSELATMVKKLEKAGFEVGSMGMLKKAPKGVDPAHPRIELLKRQGLALSFPAIPKDQIGSPKLLKWLVAQAKKTAPLVEWLIYATA